MPVYKNISKSSGIRAYGLGPDFIKVIFKDGGAYLYTIKSTSVKHIAIMQQLAVSGKGLTSYINQFVYDRYERRL